MKLGQQSWEKIIDDSWRRRVGLRFNLMLLRLDPAAYNVSQKSTCFYSTPLTDGAATENEG